MDPDPDPFHLVKRTPIITLQIVGLSLSLILFMFVAGSMLACGRSPKRKPILKKAFFYAKIDRKDGVDISDKGFRREAYWEIGDNKVINCLLFSK